MVYKLIIESQDIREVQSAVEILQSYLNPKVHDPSQLTIDDNVSLRPLIGDTVQPTVPLTIVPTGVAVDVTGVPWNPNLHSGSRKMNADGSWKKKKNFGGETTEVTPVAPVVAQPVTPLVTPPAPTVAVAPPQFAQQSSQPIVVTQPAVVEQPTYQNIPTIPQSNERPALDYQSFKNDLPMVMTRLISSGQIKQNYVDDLLKYFGIQQFYQVLGSEKHCIDLFNVLAQQGFITKVGDYPPTGVQ